MSADVIWALDQRERCIACPSAPAANAVVLHLSADGSLPREAVGQWAEDGVMAAGVVWAGGGAELTDDDWLDLEDAVTGLQGLAQVVAIFAEPELDDVLTRLVARTGVTLSAVGDRAGLLDALRGSASA